MANKSNNKTKKKVAARGGRKKKKNSSLPSIFRRIPSKLLWILIAAVIVIYIFFFYKMFVGPYSFRWKGMFGETYYPDGQVRGLDISHYQNDIDWDKLRNAQINNVGVQFIFIKATEGSDVMDVNFNQNFYNARKSGIIRGAYHYLTTKTAASKQAEFYCKSVQLEDDDLPPVLDVEEKGDYSKDELCREVRTWLDIVEKHYGVKPIIYTSYNFKKEYLNSPVFDSYPYWIAHYYVDKLQYKGKWHFWQHTDRGNVDGIDGFVDVNLFNGSSKELEKMTIQYVKTDSSENAK